MNNEIINELILACFAGDNDKQNYLRLVLEQNGETELADKIGKTWFYNLLADITGTAVKTAFNKIYGDSDFTIRDLTKIREYFNNSVSYDAIIYYINDLKEITKNEK